VNAQPEQPASCGDEGRRIDVGELRKFVEEAARSAGMNGADVELFAHALVDADLRGIESHGVTRLPVYVRAFLRGIVNPAPAISTVRAFGATELLDADNGLGVVIGQRAMDRAVELAEEHGVGAVSVRNSNHAGMLAAHVERAVVHRMIGFFTSNGPAIMPPWGGIAPRLGNGPFAWGIPTASGQALILDMACSAVARGKIRLYADRNEELPPGWALDATGHETTDPDEALEGVVLPMASYKGYGIAFVNEILAAVLAGAALAAEMPTDFLKGGSTVIDSWGCGHLALALDVSRFADPDTFTAGVEHLEQVVRDTPKLSPSDSILLPGEPEQRTRADRERDGIPVARSVRASLAAFADEIGIATPDSLR
jgi:LDH2 family malate/lactate/ureidoglycolate dehydrogenase